MERAKHNQITIEPISLSKMQDYACFFWGLPSLVSGLPSPITSKDVAATLGVKTETVRLPLPITSEDVAAIPSARIPTESFVYEKLLSMYCNAIQLPYDVAKAYARQTCAPDKIFVSGRFRESALDAIKNGREECRLETLETRYNRYEAIMTIEFTLRANRPVNEGSSLDEKHKNLEVDDG